MAPVIVGMVPLQPHRQINKKKYGHESQWTQKQKSLLARASSRELVVRL
jgi:hypothetical protein